MCDGLLVEATKPERAMTFFTTLGVIVLIFHLSCLLLSSEAHARAPRRFAGLSLKRVRHADHQAVGVFSLGRRESSKSLVTRSGAASSMYACTIGAGPGLVSMCVYSLQRAMCDGY